MVMFLPSIEPSAFLFPETVIFSPGEISARLPPLIFCMEVLLPMLTITVPWRVLSVTILPSTFSTVPTVAPMPEGIPVKFPGNWKFPCPVVEEDWPIWLCNSWRASDLPWLLPMAMPPASAPPIILPRMTATASKVTKDFVFSWLNLLIHSATPLWG